MMIFMPRPNSDFVQIHDISNQTEVGDRIQIQMENNGWRKTSCKASTS